MAMHSELWFPSVIWSAIIHSIDNSAIKSWAYQKKQNDKGRVISNHIGYQSNDILPGECTEIDNLVNYINNEINLCANQVGLDLVTIDNIWLNINPPGAYNHLHNHQNALFSGVYYVDANETQGNIQFERTDNAEYFLPEKCAKKTYYTMSKASYAAKTNALYIFPAWLKHNVTSNLSKSDRISISFNYS